MTVPITFPRSPGRVAELVFFFFYDNNLLASPTAAIRFFIEAGAADGKDQSNTWALEQAGWRGLLVEPYSLAARACHKKRPEAIVARTALVSPSYPHDTIRLAEHPDHFLCNYVVRDGPQPFAMTEEAPATTLSAVLDKVRGHYAKDGEELSPRIDFFSLDVEGYEFEVLEGTDLCRYHPAFLLVESSRREKLTDYLEFYGYKYLTAFSGHDHFFASRRVWGESQAWKFRTPDELPIPLEGGSCTLPHKGKK